VVDQAVDSGMVGCSVERNKQVGGALSQGPKGPRGLRAISKGGRKWPIAPDSEYFSQAQLPKWHAPAEPAMGFWGLNACRMARMDGQNDNPGILLPVPSDPGTPGPGAPTPHAKCGCGCVLSLWLDATASGQDGPANHDSHPAPMAGVHSHAHQVGEQLSSDADAPPDR
jgi:hypothetical protein